VLHSSEAAHAAMAAVMRFGDWACLQSHLIWIYEGPVLPHVRHGTFTSPEISCWLVRKGQVHVSVRGRAVVGRSGEWIFVAADTRTQDFNPGTEILSVHFHLAWPGGEQLYARRDSIVFKTARYPALEAAAMRLLALVRRQVPKVDAHLQYEITDLRFFLDVHRAFPDWLCAYVDTMTGLGQVATRLAESDPRALQLASILDRHPLQQRFDLQQASAQFSLTPQHLTQLFLRNFGRSPRAYLRHRQRETARQMLAHTSASIKTVSYAVGFRHESHFCAWFKRLERSTPSQFRAAARGGVR
jgi:AraC-like DNA-binding protein